MSRVDNPYAAATPFDPSQDPAYGLALKIHAGSCPLCRNPGPVDVHMVHQVWSALVLTSWRSHPELCCLSCARKAQLEGLMISLFAGWWGFPFGLIMTPVQLARGIAALCKPPDPGQPSPKLVQFAMAHIAATQPPPLPYYGAPPPPLPPSR